MSTTRHAAHGAVLLGTTTTGGGDGVPVLVLCAADEQLVFNGCLGYQEQSTDSIPRIASTSEQFHVGLVDPRCTSFCSVGDKLI